MSVVTSKLGRRLALVVWPLALIFALAVLFTFPGKPAYILIGFAVLMAGVLLGATNRMVIAPLRETLRAVTEAEAGDYFARAKVETTDEVGMLAATVNRLLAKITELRVETIDAEREIGVVKEELDAEKELATRTLELEEANAQLARRLAHLTFLYDLGRELTARRNVDALLSAFSEFVHTRLKIPEFAVLLFDESRGHSRVAAAQGFAKDAVRIGRPFKTEDTVAGEVFRGKVPVYVPDVSVDGRKLVFRMDGAASGTLFAVPVLYQDRLIGLLNFSSPQMDAFSKEQQDLFVAVAHQAALALANAQEFDKTMSLAITDGLTGVLNRRSLERRLSDEWAAFKRYNHPLSVVMLDVDYFKNYNDQHGHRKGDEALRRVARILERGTRKTDAIGRYGGEEFLVILPRATKAQAVQVAKKLRRNVEESDFPGAYMQPLGRLTVSCGVASVPDDQAGAVGALVEAADAALYEAKAAGRNTVVASQPEAKSAGKPETSRPSSPEDRPQKTD